MPTTLNIAVIGAGTMAQAVHLPVLRRRWDRFAVTALVDHSERRRRESAEVWGVAEEKRFETVADLVAAVRAKTVAVDAALLSTDGLHVDDLLLLLRRGVPVLVEPPLGYSAEEIARIADFERMTGRPLVMMAYPQQYDDSVRRVAEQVPVKDVRMIEHRVLMPASQPLFGAAHVTTSAYDLPAEQRSARRNALQEAVVAGSGPSATQRDRDLYVKGLLTGVAHQLAVIESVYGPVTELSAVRHWPKGVIPGSIELLAELEGGAHVHLVWHYLPFAPEYSETIQILSARKRLDLELFAPSHGDRRSTLHLREKKSGVITEASTVAGSGSAESMWEAFHAFVEKGEAPLSGAASARDQVQLLRRVLAAIVAAGGRDIDGQPEVEEETEEQGTAADEAPATGIEVVPPAAAVASDATADDDAASSETGAEETADGAESVEAAAAEDAAPVGGEDAVTEEPVPEEPAPTTAAIDLPAEPVVSLGADQAPVAEPPLAEAPLAEAPLAGEPTEVLPELPHPDEAPAAAHDTAEVQDAWSLDQHEGPVESSWPPARTDTPSDTDPAASSDPASDPTSDAEAASDAPPRRD